jgi:hypothetical protein
VRRRVRKAVSLHRSAFGQHDIAQSSIALEAKARLIKKRNVFFCAAISGCGSAIGRVPVFLDL